MPIGNETYIAFKEWFDNKILQTPTGELRELYSSVQLVLGEFEKSSEFHQDIGE